MAYVEGNLDWMRETGLDITRELDRSNGCSGNRPSLVRNLGRRARGPSVELVKSVYYHREMSKLEYSRFRFAQGIGHHGSMNCNAKIVNRYLDAQAYSSSGFLVQLDQFIDFAVSKRASQVRP
ncbi:hypothetical protein CRG98_035030 [Punica granatum]|uniref:Uncharacterized protein n=1 Tax=Punica granatum TaxID=22663 RepID=A0A2I0IKQ0_PUNGR|nr:hypothetical protein CRG98_035030 [Punica granatum]